MHAYMCSFVRSLSVVLLPHEVDRERIGENKKDNHEPQGNLVPKDLIPAVLQRTVHEWQRGTKGSAYKET